MTQEKLLLTTAASLTALLVGYIGYSVFKSRKYVLKSKVRKLMLYPIKSLPGVEVDHLEVEKNCLKYKNFLDRSFVLVDHENRFITLRTEPTLAKIKMTLVDDHIQLDAPNMPTLRISNTGSLKKDEIFYSFEVWGEEIDGQDCGKEVTDWFSKYLGRPIKLMRHHPLFGYRKAKTLVNNELVRVNEPNNSIMYQDGAPISMINEKSVKDLNQRIQRDHGDEKQAFVESERFRMNINFETDVPFEEDSWSFIKINNSEFQFVIECGRCKLTTLNRQTGEYEKEPLRTLKKYRMGPKHIFDGAPLLGCYIKTLKTGKINVGDDILVAM